MRANRRRQRSPDPLASPDAVRAICQRLREHFPRIIPNKEKDLVRFLYAVRHIERHPATDTRRGRPGRWTRKILLEAASQLRGILQRETLGRVSVSSFTGQYLQVLQFPADVIEALTSGDINLQEAVQLARLTPARLKCTPVAARTRRRELLQSHLAMQGSQTRLRLCVKEILGESAATEITSKSIESAVAVADQLLEINASDARHLFWEEMKRIFYAMREIEPEDLDDETLDEFLGAIDHLSTILYRIEKRREARQREHGKISD